MNDKTILSFKDLEARLSYDASEEVKELLSSTILGSKGGMRYMLRDIPARIATYTNIRFVSLFKANRLTGTVGLCYRMVTNGNRKYHGSYLRYLSFMPMFQNALDAKGPGDKRRRLKESESMKSKILSFFRKPYMLDLPGYGQEDKHVIYAYVESMNERSKNLIHQVGFEYIRSFLTVAFSRFNPVADSRVSLLPAGEVETMRSLLTHYYHNYSFYTDEFTFTGQQYYVLKEGDEIIAGISAMPSSYLIVDMPGVWGWVFMNVLSKLPGYKKLFTPGEFRFLVFGSIYFKPGREKALEQLMESVCALENFYTGLTWVDDRSPIYEILRGSIDMGSINRMLNAKPGLVYASFVNMSEEDKDSFFEQPAFISGFDFT